jgi:hypothetical protein
MQLRPVNFPVEDGQLLTQGEILCSERGPGQDQAPDEQKERGDEDQKCEANHRNKDEPDDRAEWLMISLTVSISKRDEVFGRDRYEMRFDYTRTITKCGQSRNYFTTYKKSFEPGVVDNCRF